MRARATGARARRGRSARFDLRDLAREVLEGAGARPFRLVVSLLGTVVGIGALVLTIGLGQTAGGQLAEHFDAVAATHLEVAPRSGEGADGQDRPAASFPVDAVERIDRLVGVTGSALLAPVPGDGLTVSAVPVRDPSAAETAPPAVIALTGDLTEAVGATFSHGRAFDRGHEERGDRVVVLGAEAAEALGVVRLDAQPVVFVGGQAYTVIGILAQTVTHGELRNAAVVPLATARRDFRGIVPDALAVAVQPGAGSSVAHQAPIALDPNDVEAFTAGAPPETTVLEAQVGDDLGAVFFAVGLITLLAGALGIANVTLLSVTERTGEIGLRRALGATRGQIGAQFVGESVLLGLLGGVIGVALAVLAIVVVAAVRGWTPVLDPLLGTGCAVLGGLVGLVAGAYPALKAARTEPAEALRGGT